jgi:hypothetical protein
MAGEPEGGKVTRSRAEALRELDRQAKRGSA